MLSRVNSCSRSFVQRFDSIETHYPEPIRTCGNGIRPDPLGECSGRSRSSNPDNSCVFGGLEESEVVDELHQILVDCLKKADIRSQEILLRKFFFEIEKEIPLQRFLVERLKQSKISSLFDEIPERSDDDERFFLSESETEINTREINMCEGETSEKLEKFKVRTVQVGVDVKEEAEAS